jgi:hypothetical protein
MQSAARSCHEALNKCLKNWGILEKVYRHHIKMQGMVFYVCAVITQLVIAVITQLPIANREPLFEVEYGDEY